MCLNLQLFNCTSISDEPEHLDGVSLSKEANGLCETSSLLHRTNFNVVQPHPGPHYTPSVRSMPRPLRATGDEEPSKPSTSWLDRTLYVSGSPPPPLNIHVSALR